MTLEEKVGEMTQLTLTAVSKTMGTASQPHELDLAKLEEAIVGHHVGSVLNVWDVASTMQHWHDVIATIQRAAQRRRLQIPVLYGIDAVHGHNYLVGATLFPQNLAMAATWDPELVRRANEITAIEVRASGIPWNFSPVLDLARQPLWSRFFETFGEDVHLASVMGVAAVRGLQGDDVGDPLRVAATGKHFLGYGMPRTGRDRTPAWIPERMLHEYFVPPFQAAIDAGLRTVMINSGDINHVPVHASREILTDLLRTRLGFTGVAVTDWEDIIKLHTVHRVAATPKEAVRIAVLAGIDMSMVPYDLSFHRDLVALVREGAVPESRIDESVRRILQLKLDLGLFERPFPDRSLAARVGASEFEQVSRRAAAEAVTLLKNDGLLPLKKDMQVLITGPGAHSLPALHGSWTYRWQGTDQDMYPRDARTVLGSLLAEVGAERVTYVPGATFDREVDVAAAAEAARHADVAIVALAEWPSTEKVGDIDDLRMPDAQLKLARAIEATGTPVVLVLLENRPRIVREAVDSARAIVLGYQSGPFAADAIIDVIFGDENPSGRLPFTYPRYPHALVQYDHVQAEQLGPNGPEGGYVPEWDFGHGLSYTTFAYDALKLQRSTLARGDTLVVTVNVTNIGDRAGKEVAQLYVRDLYATVSPPVRRLRSFQKIELAPGERRTLVLRVPVRDLAHVGLDNQWIVEPGEFEVMIGGLRSGFVVR